MKLLARLSLVRLLLAGGGVILLAGMLVIGTWVQKEIGDGVIHHEGEVFALYVDSIVSNHVDSLAAGGPLSDADRIALDRLFFHTKIGARIVVFKMWSRDGRILYSTNSALIGRQFGPKPALVTAFGGTTISHISALTDAEHEFERGNWPQLIETYAPIHERKTGSIVGIAEIYQTTDEVAQAVSAARLRSWLMVSTATLIIFLLLAALVKRASNTIVVQQTELREKVSQLTTLLAQNEQLHERVRRAAARTTALNERFLHRIAADLHDGPGQGLALALMRMESLADMCGICAASVGKDVRVGDEFHILHSALQLALEDLRAIAGGLHLPEIEQLSLAETARRAVRDYERKAGREVPLSIDDIPDAVPLPVKITLFRVLQESLANGFRHGGAPQQRVELTRSDGQLVVEVTDSGKGFDPQAGVADGHLGLSGMRERIEILGGTFSVQSTPGKGTVVRAALPLAPLAEAHE